VDIYVSHENTVMGAKQLGTLRTEEEIAEIVNSSAS
jgi:hypothetical protein